MNNDEFNLSIMLFTRVTIWIKRDRNKYYLLEQNVACVISWKRVRDRKRDMAAFYVICICKYFYFIHEFIDKINYGIDELG